jgi:hypothetical protein
MAMNNFLIFFLPKLLKLIETWHFLEYNFLGERKFLFLEKKFLDDSGKGSPNGLEDRPA